MPLRLLPVLYHLHLSHSTMPKSKKVGTKRKRKDPNRPKNAPTAYILFCQAQRPKVVAEHPNADFAATNKMLGEMWRAQPPEVQNVCSIVQVTFVARNDMGWDWVWGDDGIAHRCHRSSRRSPPC